ncbi:MAG TPA: ISAs1 family transposase [Clostridiales bacterium]|nr:MAG: hypothetical protein A2Y18_08140 [Clostridiales bacterium GWD2_32_19]HCC08158.1 ISAs1 family transposase [Clostridiales bacterium]
MKIVLKIKGQIVTIDAMGTQTKIAEKIIEAKADNVLALKGNQGNLSKDVAEYFDEEVKKEIRAKGITYLKTIEKSHNRIETREYYQTDDIKWLDNRENWKKLNSVIMEETTIENKKGDKRAVLNMNHIRKMCFKILKELETKKKRSMKKKRFMIGLNAQKYIERIFRLV